MVTTSWRNGERNIVERASERKATTVSSKWSVEPEIPLPAPFSSAQASAALPAPTYQPVTVENAMDFLACLPQSLSEPERCLQVQEFLRERGAEGSLVAAELVGEAAQKIVEIHQSLKGQKDHDQNRHEQRTRLDELMGVIVLFDNYQSFVMQQKREQEDPLRSQLKHHGRLAFV